jgi:hypothetical protein
MGRTAAFVFAVLAVTLPGCGGGGPGADLAVIPPKTPATFTPGVAFLADAEVDESVELFVADLDGDGSLEVSGALVAGGDVVSFQWSPDRALLGFLADKDADDVVELYVVAAGGGAVTKASGPLIPGGDVWDFQWSPDSARLAYRADQEEDDVFELFTAPAQGGLSVQVSGTLPKDASIGDYGWAPDSSRIAYVADQDELGAYELFTSLAAGGGNVQVSGAMVPGGHVTDIALGGVVILDAPFQWAPDSSRIAYLATQDDANVLELFSSLPAGGGNLKVNAPLAPDVLIDPSVYAFAWAPDSARIAYAANQEENEEGDVFVAAPDGSGNTQVMDAGEYGVFAFRLAWSPDGAWIAGLANFHGHIDVGALFAVSPLGPAVGFAAVGASSFVWTPDSTRLALASQDLSTPGAVATITPADLGVFGVLPQVVSSFAAGEQVRAETLSWAPDGSRLAYLSEDLHVSFPTTAYGAERITPLLHGTDRSVRKFQWAPDSLRLVFSADIGAAQMIELFMSPRDAASLVVVSPPLVFGGQVLDFEVR